MKGSIIVSCGSLTHGGAERVLSVLSKPFADHYDSVEYVMWDDLPIFYEIDKRVKLVCIKRECGSASRIKQMWWFRRYVNKTKPSIVLSFSAPYNMLSLCALLTSNTKIIVAERVDPRSFRWGYLLKKSRDILYGKAKGILAQTEQSKSYFTGKLLRKTSVIYNPVTMSSEMVGIATKTTKQPLIVTAARLAPQKRQDLLIECFAQFSQTHPEYRLAIYGSGAELSNLQQKATDYGVTDKVLFPGNVQDLWNRIVPAKMFIMTSLFEGMSNSLIEAMCLGIPCISTKVSGATDLIRHKENGFLVDIGDKDAICEYMERIASDEHLATLIGQEASKLYDSLNVEQISQQWIEYINQQITM